jgi:hypothetical protein
MDGIFFSSVHRWAQTTKEQTVRLIALSYVPQHTISYLQGAKRHRPDSACAPSVMIEGNTCKQERHRAGTRPRRQLASCLSQDDFRENGPVPHLEQTYTKSRCAFKIWLSMSRPRQGCIFLGRWFSLQPGNSKHWQPFHQQVYSVPS